MKLEIRTTKKNMLLSREEIHADVFFEGKTPARLQVHKEAAKKIGCPEDHLIVKEIKTLYGQQKAQATFYKYDSKELLEKLEPAYLQKKHKPKEKKGEEKTE